MSWWRALLNRFSNRTPWLYPGVTFGRWPILVYLDDSTEAGQRWRPFIVEAIAELNRCIGWPCLRWCDRAPPGYVEGFMRSGQGFVNEILVQADGIDDGAHEEPIYKRGADGKRITIWAGRVILPVELPKDLHLLHTIPLHEFGHALGFGHARHPSSFMWPNASESGGLILDHETWMLRDAYGSKG